MSPASLRILPLAGVPRGGQPLEAAMSFAVVSSLSFQGITSEEGS